jgi:putative SOS response-associated peptidase YedK
MCGRYSLSGGQTDADFQQVLNQYSKKYPQIPLPAAEIFPTNTVPALFFIRGAVRVCPAVWGIPAPAGRGVLINARAETARDKKLFQTAVAGRRCVIPAAGFFEWSHDSQKQKYRFTAPDNQGLYFAGLYNLYDGKPRFVILTTAPNASMAGVHTRMPLALLKSQVRQWLADQNAVASILASVPPSLSKKIVE